MCWKRGLRNVTLFTIILSNIPHKKNVIIKRTIFFIQINTYFALSDYSE